ncbi:GNAT family N-acetyltransferase [Actinomadura gamaensis]|uniref:GNAT family N-acetyltransferase n=1 Tax=Actinomadura gamaensis TaxID=1763541 RepID=A0ABV9TYT0_9ACTN
MEIALGLPEEARRAAAELYWEAFERELTPVVGGPHAVDTIADGLHLDRVIGAWDGGELLGIAAVRDRSGPVLEWDARRLRRDFGPLRGLWRTVLSTMLDAKARPGELLLDSLAVSSAARGKGVGTKLLQATVDEARRRGLRRVRLEVVDTNPRARALYERFGFRWDRTERTPYLRKLMGFSSVDDLVLDVRADRANAPRPS